MKNLYIIIILLFSLSMASCGTSKTSTKPKTEVAKKTIKCEYCGTVNGASNSACEACAAPLGN
ncbi:MAG: hypothetical protein GY810_29210 [Aureispira sp.]|nr:hypothetical protein [Aureispira sp.]